MKKSIAVSIILFLIISLFSGVVNAAGTKTVKEGENVSVTISLGKSVTSAAFQSVSWSSDKLQYVSNSLGKSLSNGGKLGFFGDTEISSVTLTFKALSAGTATVKVNITEIGPDTVSKTDTTNITITAATKQTESTSQSTTSSTGSNSGTTTSSSSNSSTSKSSSSSSSSKTSSASNNSNQSTTKKEETKQEETTKQEEQATEEVVATVEEKQVAPNELIELQAQDVKTLQNEQTNIMVKGLPIAIEDEVTLDVNEIKEDSDKYKALNDIMKEIKGRITYFNIQLMKNDVAIQPNGYVTVCIPIPEYYDKNRVEVYYINEENGSYELMEGEVQDNYYTFTTNHFSTYAMVEKEAPKTFGETLQDFFKNYTVLYTIIGILVFVVIIETIVIIRLSKEN